MAGAVVDYHHNVGDTQTPIAAQIIVDDEPLDVTGLTVQFKMVLASDNSVKVNWGTGAIVDATAGKVSYTFTDSDIDTAGEYYGWFRVVDGDSDYDTFPKEADADGKSRKWKIYVNTVG